MLRGAIAAAITPLRDGGDALDADAFEPYVDFLAGGGLDGLLAMGTTGEGILLTVPERRRVAELYIAAARGRLAIAIHCGAQTTADTVELAKKHKPKIVVASFEICQWLGGKGVESCSGMNLGGSQDVLGLHVTMVRADHSSGLSDGDKILYGGLASGYMVKLPGGYTFYHAGDTALFSDMQLLCDIYRPELAFLPIGDLFGMSPREAAVACRLLNARRVIPMHYATFPPLTGTPEALRKLTSDLKEMEIVPLKPGETLT